jgi:hypothetical protein
MAGPYVPSPDSDSMVKVQHFWDWYFTVVEREAKQNYVRFFTPPIPHGRALT